MKWNVVAPLCLFLAVACQDAQSPTIAGDAVNVTAPVNFLKAGNRKIPGQYIVVFKKGIADPATRANGLVKKHRGTMRFAYARTLKGFSAQMTEAEATKLASDPDIAFIEQDQEVSLADIVVQPIPVSGDWGLDRIDAATGLDGQYSYSANGAGVYAYIIDTGIRGTHSQFGSRVVAGFTSVKDGNGTNDCNGHGTHVSGTVGGTTYGVAKGVTLVPVRVLDCSGSGSWSGVIAGVEWVTNNHAGHPAVANMSLGGGVSSAVDQAIANSIASGVSYAVAAGNGNAAGVAQNACNSSPARLPEAMTIGATDKTDTKASWSNYGPCVDWFAPGVGITSAWNTNNTATNTISGTSMATPHAVGVAALYLQAFPNATPQEVRDALFGAATKSVVFGSNSANNHLLYTPSTGFAAAPPPPPVNVAPTADFTSTCINLACSFTNTSVDPEGATMTSAWSFGDGTTSTTTSPSRTFALGGTYLVQLVVTDAGGLASATMQRSVVVVAPNQTPSANFSFSCTNLACTFTNSSVDPEGASMTSAWDFGDGTTSTATNPSRTFTAGGTYQVKLVVTDAAGAPSLLVQKAVIVAPANQAPTANFSFNCTNLACTFTNSSVDPEGASMTSAWDFGDGTTSTATNPSRTFTAGGTYQVKLVVTDAAGAPSLLVQKAVIVAPANQAPTANFSFNCTNLACTFTNSSVDPEGASMTSAWDFGDGTTSTATNPSRTFTAGGTYQVKLVVTDAAGAPSLLVQKAVIVAPANQAPTANFSFSCTNLACTFTNSSVDPEGASMTSAWDFGDGTTSTATNPSRTFTAGGTYQVKLVVTDAAGAPSLLVQKAVIVAPANQAPTANFSFNCTNLACTFTNSSVDPEGASMTSAWDFGDGTTSTATNPSRTFTAGGTYQVKLVVTDAAGAPSLLVQKAVIVAPANQAPTANFSFSCTNLACTFTNSSVDPEGALMTSAWDFGDGTTSTSTNPAKTFAAGGTYQVKLVVTDAAGAPSPIVQKAVLVVPANQAPTANFTFNCTNLACIFTNSSVDPEGASMTSAWDFGDGTTSTATNPSRTFTAGGTYQVKLVVTDAAGAPSPIVQKAVLVVPANQAPTANFTFNCTNLACTFTNSSVDPEGASMTSAWDFGDGTTSTSTNPAKTFAAGGTYQVKLVVTDAAGAPSPIVQKAVLVVPANQAPTANFTFNCTNLVCTFTNTSVDPEGTSMTSVWNFGDGTTSTATNPSRTFAAAGNFNVSLVVTDGAGVASVAVQKPVSVTSAPSVPEPTLTVSISGGASGWMSTLTFGNFQAGVKLVDIYRNGTFVGTRGVTPNRYIEIGSGPTVSYKVCVYGSTTVCSATVTKTIP